MPGPEGKMAENVHKRENLLAFINKNITKDEEKKKADKLYKDLLQDEVDLLEMTKDQFVKPLKTPPKEFTLDDFKKTVKDNTITRALQAHFTKGKTFLAAWEYVTLKQSHDSLQILTGKKQDPQEIVEGEAGNVGGDRPPRNLRFNTPEGTNNQGQHVSVIPVAGQQRGITQKKTSQCEQQEGATGGQAHTEDIDMPEDHVVQAHVHGHFAGYDETAAMPEEDDTKSSILTLLWTHHDYFDQKALSRAQAEYNFYRVLKREWTKAMERLKIDDIQYGPFDMAQFYQLPRNRPLYAVILTICEQSKDKSQGHSAAEEYVRLKILEHTMRQQEIIKSIPPGIDLDDAHYNELFQNMKSRFKSSGSQAQLRQAGEFKMIPLFEYLKLKETITNQRNQIEELASRLSGIASQQLAEGEAGFTDLGDKNRPQKLGERFAELFDETWSSAYESLKPKKETKGDDDDSDEKTMDVLQHIVKIIYEFCQRVSQEQITRIIAGMIPPIIDPMNVGKKDEAAAVPSASDQMKSKTEQIAREYRKVVAHATIKVLQKEIMEKEIKGKILVDPVGKELDTYIQQCVDLIWYMCIQQPAMELVWAKPGEKFNREQFRFSGKKGKTYKLTVWPAVFLQKDGPLVAPGYAVPE